MRHMVDFDQTARPRSLIKIFPVCITSTLILGKLYFENENSDRPTLAEFKAHSSQGTAQN